MKIAFLSTFYPFRGGISQFNGLIYRELEKHHQVQAYSFTRQYPNILFPGKTQYVTEKDTVDRIPTKRVLDTINPFSYLKTAREIRKFAPDLFLSRYWMPFFAPSHGFVAGRMKSAVRIAILDNVIPHEQRFFDGPLNRYFLKRFDGFVVMSDAVMKDLLSIRPNAPYLRIDHPSYSQFGERKDAQKAKELLGLSQEKKILLFFGIIRDYKGLGVLLDAFAKLDESYHLVIAGESYGSFEKYQKQMDVLGVGDRISLFNEYIPEDEVSNYFSAADVCVLPYLSATQSGITAIAHHFGVPVIVTDVGGLKETVLHEETGLVIEKPDATILAGAIQRYYAEEFKERFSKRLLENQEEDPWDHFVGELLNFYQELKAKKGNVFE
ncbi:MAG: glycosyltransferase [Bacteroidetes bacterium]|nr:MAG: glycosyltransferase [Bacteroidota bacterium]